MKLKDRVAIVTGAARGIGRAIALALAEEGAIIVCVDVAAPEKSEALVNEITGMGGEAEAYQADVRDFEAIEKMAQHVIEKYNRLDILVNNAGVNRDALILMMTPAAWALRWSRSRLRTPPTRSPRRRLGFRRKH